MTQETTIQQMLKQIEKLTQNYDCKERMKILVTELKDRIETSERLLKTKIQMLKKSQNTLFAEIMLEKNDEVTKLQTEVNRLKSNLMQSSQPTSAEELLCAKNEVFRLKEALKKRNDELRQMTIKSIEAETQIAFLEKQKLQTKMPSDTNIRTHFKTIRKELLSNRNFLKFMQMRVLSNSQKCLSDTDF